MSFKGAFHHFCGRAIQFYAFLSLPFYQDE